MRLAAILSCNIIALLTIAASGQISSQAGPTPGEPEPLPPMLRSQPPAPQPPPPPPPPLPLDARTAPRATQLRAVSTISFNPHPYSTFSGALFYFSVTPRTTPAACSAQASARASRTVAITPIARIPFTHGYDEHGTICTESRDEIYTTPRNDSCYRFDAVINTFCGGDVSGVQDIPPRELAPVRTRMQTILDSVKFDTK